MVRSNSTLSQCRRSTHTHTHTHTNNKTNDNVLRPLAETAGPSHSSSQPSWRGTASALHPVRALGAPAGARAQPRRPTHRGCRSPADTIGGAASHSNTWNDTRHRPTTPPQAAHRRPKSTLRFVRRRLCCHPQALRSQLRQHRYANYPFTHSSTATNM